MLPRNQPDGIHIAFDDHRLVNNAGLILPATLALHLGLSQLVDRHLDLGRAPGPGEHRRQDDDPGGFRAGGRRLHRRRRCVAHRQDGLRSRLRSQSAIHPGHLPAQLHLGPRPPAGRGEPRVAGRGPGRPAPDPATRHSPSTLIRRSARLTDWPRRAPAITAIPARGAITHCWPSPPEPATC